MRASLGHGEAKLLRLKRLLALALATLGVAWPSAEAEELDLAAATALAEDPAQLERTWNRGFVMVPGAALGEEADSFFGFFEDPTIQGLLAQVPEVAVIQLLFRRW